MFNQERPYSIDAEQIERKENHGDQSNDGRIFDFVGRGPRDAAHLSARVTQKMRGATDEAFAGWLTRLALTTHDWRRFRHSSAQVVFFFTHLRQLRLSTKSWQGDQDSNPDFRFWRPTC